MAAIADAEFGDKTESYMDVSQEFCILVCQTLFWGCDPFKDKV